MELFVQGLISLNPLPINRNSGITSLDSLYNTQSSNTFFSFNFKYSTYFYFKHE